jgi:hypothetical protein
MLLLDTQNRRGTCSNDNFANASILSPKANDTKALPIFANNAPTRHTFRLAQEQVHESNISAAGLAIWVGSRWSAAHICVVLALGTSVPEWLWCVNCSIHLLVMYNVRAGLMWSVTTSFVWWRK